MTGESQIADYGLIGDGRSAALIDRRGSIDWLCWPRFDSPAMFWRLLDRPAGGHWQIAPTQPFQVRRRYLENAPVLVTTFVTSSGEAELVDYMPAASVEEQRRGLSPEHELVRLVSGRRGEVELQLSFMPRPAFGRDPPRLRKHGALGVRLEDRRGLHTLRADFDLQMGGDGGATATIRVRAGDRRTAVLSHDSEAPAVLPPLPELAQDRLAGTLRWWRGWTGRCRYRGPYRAEVIRSAITVKLLSFAPSGAMIAAPTTSLPERLGGQANWDYRFCWLRDASLTVRALLDLGYTDEAGAFVSWLLHSTRLTRPRLRVLYDVTGNLPPPERLLSELRGHRASRPVRLYNGALEQLQLDVYGEVIDAVAQIARSTAHAGPGMDRETSAMLLAFGRYVCDNAQKPDQGIWEPRGAPEHNTHSRALCWVALDRLIEMQQSGLLARRHEAEFRRRRDELRQEIDTRAWNPRIGSFTKTLGGDSVDASLLLLGWYGAVAPDDARMVSTFQRITRELSPAPGLYYRSPEHRRDGEGAFGACGFWAVEQLARSGDVAGAVQMFEQLLSRSSDLGLYAEQIDSLTGMALGNFPQAFTHIGLLSAATTLERCARESRLQERPLPQWQPAQPEGPVP